MTPEQNTSPNIQRAIQPGIDRPMRIGTRQSPLAMVQAEMVMKALRSSNGWSSDQVELVPMIATGDKIQDRALADIGGKALWTKELDRALLEGDIDCAVHSMKDVETVRPNDLIIAAMLERADTHDRIIGAQNIKDLPEGAVVGTASPRRKAQLLRQRSDLDIRLIRGNVQTRLNKIRDGQYDASLLAAAGLERLGMSDIGTRVSHGLMLPAPAQGAIGIEARSEDQVVRRLLHNISHTETYRAVIAERMFLLELGADCHSPVAALAVIDNHKLLLRAELLLPDGSEYVAHEISFESGEVNAPQRLARHLLGEASDKLRAIFGK